MDHFNMRTYVLECRLKSFYSYPAACGHCSHRMGDLLVLVPAPSASRISGACALDFSLLCSLLFFRIGIRLTV